MSLYNVAKRLLEEALQAAENREEAGEMAAATPALTMRPLEGALRTQPWRISPTSSRRARNRLTIHAANRFLEKTLQTAQIGRRLVKLLSPQRRSLCDP